MENDHFGPYHCAHITTLPILACCVDKHMTNTCAQNIDFTTIFDELNEIDHRYHHPQCDYLEQMTIKTH